MAFVAVGLAVSPGLLNSQEERRAAQTRRQVIDEAVADAERRGTRDITVSLAGVILDHPVLESLDDVNDYYSIILGEPVAATVLKGEYAIATLYTVQVQEIFQRQRVIPPSEPDAGLTLALPAVGAGRVLVGMAGGKLRVRGVTVHQAGTQLEVGAKYVFVLRLVAGRNVSWPATGEESVFKVGSDGSLAPLKDSELAGDFRSRGATSLDSVRKLLGAHSR